MKNSRLRSIFCSLAALGAIVLAALALKKPAAAQQADAPESGDGFVSIFDGKSLDGWDGDPRLWRVEDGAIVGQTTEENSIDANTFLIWREGELDDFELKLDYRIEGGNSGIQVRSFELPNRKWGIGGYQSDIDSGGTYTGIVYGEQFRGILAQRGEKTVIGNDGKPEVVETFGEKEELGKAVRSDDWNSYRIKFEGNTLTQWINGERMAEVTDEDEDTRLRKGLLAFQLHTGPPMKVSFRNIMLKRLPLEDRKKIVFFAGKPSHGWGAHEHNAGCLLLAEMLNEHAGDRVLAAVYQNGWPSDPTALQNADALVIYCDGGGGHMAISHLEEIDRFMSRGKGLSCIHYAVEVPKGEPGDHFLKWLGGYFETNWSVNPHWDASFDDFPEHAACRGVHPFSIRDEWYYHMRFRDGMKGVTPILSDLPPKETLSRGDGPHSGNPAVREAVASGEPQHVAWVSENEDGSRGFGFTGGHFHRNWQNDEFRKVVLNAIAWTAKADVPESGIESPTPSDEEMDANQDEPKPENR